MSCFGSVAEIIFCKLINIFTAGFQYPLGKDICHTEQLISNKTSNVNFESELRYTEARQQDENAVKSSAVYYCNC